MRITGYFLVAIGSLRLLGTLARGLRFYDLSSARDLTQLAGGVGFALLLLIGGLALLKRTRIRDRISPLADDVKGPPDETSTPR